MGNELRPDNLGEVWRAQDLEHTQMTLTEIREKARKFQRKILFRNLREYAAIAVVVVFFGFGMGKYPPWMRAGAGLCIAGGYTWHTNFTEGARRRAWRRIWPRQAAWSSTGGNWSASGIWFAASGPGIWDPSIPGLALMVVARRAG